MQCPSCQNELAENATVCPACNTPVVSNPYAADPLPATNVSAMAQEGDATGGLIPYKNPKALIAYYLGIFSGIPLIGLPIGIAAVVLGVLGLRERSRNPVIKGSIHAGIGIGCGLLFTLLWGVAFVAMIVAMVVA